ENTLLIRVVPLHGDLNDNAIALCAEIEHGFVQTRLVGIQIIHERANAAFILKHFFSLGRLVRQANAHAGVEKRKLAQTLGQNVVFKLYVGKDTAAWVKPDYGTGLFAVTDDGQRLQRFTHAVILLVDAAIALDRKGQA